MSTFIKVTQEGSELLRRNAEQTQGRRLAKLEGDEQRRTEQQAREARQQALLQQGLAPSGDPFDDARRRRFRPDELAATRLIDDALIVAWDNGQPVIRNQRGTIIEWYEFGSVPSTLDDLGGIPAVSVLPYFPENDSSYGNIGLTAKPYINAQYLSACTLEAWGELVALSGGPVNSRYAVDIRMNWNYSDVPLLYADSFVFCAYDFAPSGLSNPLSIPPYERAPGNFLYCYSRPEVIPGETPVSEEEVFIGSSPPVGSFHVCIQIAGYQISYYLNGLLIRRYTLPSLNILTEKLQVSAFASSVGTLSIAKLSEIRFTINKTRYPLDGFVPNRPPFRR